MQQPHYQPADSLAYIFRSRLYQYQARSLARVNTLIQSANLKDSEITERARLRASTIIKHTQHWSHRNTTCDTQKASQHRMKHSPAREHTTSTPTKHSSFQATRIQTMQSHHASEGQLEYKEIIEKSSLLLYIDTWQHHHHHSKQ